ncbi:XRE family transcriptional regulator [Streptomyces sp. NPDC048392]|uniref:XRE family transcriptional regulator n=1 Tax=Streptomyces sp. NPDC048392 TaxID=3365543 RepID=UPI00371B6B34
MRAAAARRGLRSGTDEARVRKWQRGVKPNEESQIYIAEALGWPADIVRADDWPNWVPLTADGVVSLGPHSSVPALREALRTAMERRTFFTISGAALSALAADWAAGPVSALAQARDGKPIGEDFVVFLENTTQELAGHATEQRQHTAVLLDAHLSTVTELLEHGRYTPALGLRLHTLAASLSQTVAWHRFDQGRHTHASQNWIAGLHNAHAAGDHDMGAGLLGDLAYQAAWRRDHTTAASILHHALTRAHNPAARCLLQLRLARTLAARGDRSERRNVLRALAAAEQHLSDAGTDRPSWCAWVSEADVAVDSGQALLDLGDTGRAHQLITEGERLLPTARDKTRGVFLAYRAASYLDLQEPEPAAAAATQSLLLARRIGAPRCVSLVDDLLPRFQPYTRAQGVPELLQLAAA